MRQTGQYRIDAPAHEVWDALHDPSVLVDCIDGCQSIVRKSEDAFEARLRARVGPLSAAFNAELVLTDLDPPRGYSLEAHVKGGPVGFGRGRAKVSLAEDGAGTVLHYEAEGSLGGKLAQVAQRLVEATTQSMADDFFNAFGQRVNSPVISADLAAAARVERPGPWLALAMVGTAAVGGLALILLHH